MTFCLKCLFFMLLDYMCCSQCERDEAVTDRVLLTLLESTQEDTPARDTPHQSRISFWIFFHHRIFISKLFIDRLIKNF